MFKIAVTIIHPLGTSGVRELGHKAYKHFCIHFFLNTVMWEMGKLGTRCEYKEREDNSRDSAPNGRSAAQFFFFSNA